MNTSKLDALLEQLSAYQQKILQICAQHATYFNTQHHADLSPLGWHLGHCVYTETFWIREQLLHLPPTSPTLRTYYTPALSQKQQRGTALPDYNSLHQWAKNTQQENLNLLETHMDRDDHPLLRNNFLLHFLVQHYAQHLETMQMILLQKALQEAPQFIVKHPLTHQAINPVTITLDAGNYTVGATTEHLPYDNEYPAHSFSTDSVHIAQNPVSNGEFLSFMIAAGYQKKQYWSQPGWEWKEQNAISHPAYWKKDNRGNWFGIDIQGPHHLIADHPISGISYFEAQAFSAWAEASLLHEHEWEIAMQRGYLKGVGHAWEWCRNSFYPYQHNNKQFKAFPYSAYSEPYFDNQHFVMRGSSHYTKPVLQRSTFRNYYRADKRHQFAGCRIVFS